jgi:hypothetical protein
MRHERGAAQGQVLELTAAAPCPPRVSGVPVSDTEVLLVAVGVLTWCCILPPSSTCFFMHDSLD